MRLRWGLVVVVIVFVVGAVYYQTNERRRHRFFVAFLNVGQGDSTLINFADGATMLVDCGANRRVLGELGKFIPFYIRDIEYLIATHPDLDHYGGCVDVLRRYRVHHIVVNGRTKPHDPFWQTWNETVQNEGAEVITMASPTVWTISGDRLEFLSPDSALPLSVGTDDNNNFSIVFRLTHASTAWLFTGDMEEPLEQALLKKYCVHSAATSTPCPALQSDILKVGHHGSDSSSGEMFLSAVRAETAIISVGPNKYGHPSRRVLRHLERARSAILRTDLEGAILLR